MNKETVELLNLLAGRRGYKHWLIVDNATVICRLCNEGVWTAMTPMASSVDEGSKIVKDHGMHHLKENNLLPFL